MKIMTRSEQRQQSTNRKMMAVGLYCHLRNLLRNILAGDATLLPEFQQMVQHAPAGTREALLQRLEEAC